MSDEITDEPGKPSEGLVMGTYIVTVTRTETIDFQIEADSEADATERYLMDGDEVGSQTTNLDVLEVKEA